MSDPDVNRRFWLAVLWGLAAAFIVFVAAFRDVPLLYGVAAIFALAAYLLYPKGSR